MDEPLIIQSQDILNGRPVFYGTRVPVQNLVDYLMGGDSIDEFLEDFPAVRREQVLSYLASAAVLVASSELVHIE